MDAHSRQSVVLCRTGPRRLREDLERVLALAGADALAVLDRHGLTARVPPGARSSSSTAT